MRNSFLVAICALCASCSAPDQESVRHVAAVEVRLATSADHKDLIAILRRHAAVDGSVHVDDVTERWKDFESQSGPVLPGGKGTIYVGVWRGWKDNELIADVNDMGHPGRAWVTFVRGKDIPRATRFRTAALKDIRRRWPNAMTLPVLPSGGLPLPEHLRPTPNGYKVDPAAAANYDLPQSSPLIAR